MAEAPSYKRDWVLTADAFEALLFKLHPDRERAGQEYERIREKLLNFFRWRGCRDPQEFADRTIDRVARKIMEGAELRVRDPYLFFHGVARNVLREHWRAPGRDLETLDELPSSLVPANDPAEMIEPEEERQEHERRLECLSECLQSLPANRLELVTKYHKSEGRAKIEDRKELAERLSIPLNALRLRVSRIRTEIERCVDRCLQEFTAE